MDPNLPKKYDFTLKIDEKKVPMIPYILNLCGDLFGALIKELEHVGEEGLTKKITCQIDPLKDPKERVLLHVGEEQIEIKAFIQDMIWKTLAGFLSSLKKIPEDLLEKPIALAYQIIA